MSYVNYRSRQVPSVFRYLLELGRYRHLCFNLVGSDLRSRFRRSRLGILWAIIQPLAFALLLALIYGEVFKMGSYWDYAIFVFSGMIVWEAVSVVINVSLDALINAQGYIKQARIPLLAFQLRTPMAQMVIFACGLLGLFGLQIVLGQLPPITVNLLYIPAFFAVLFLFLAPVAVICSILGTKFRDVKYITAIALQAVFFLSPIFMTRDVLNRPELWFMPYANPMIPLMELFRRPALHGEAWPINDVIILGVWWVGLTVVAIAASLRVRRKIVFAI